MSDEVQLDERFLKMLISMRDHTSQHIAAIYGARREDDTGALVGSGFFLSVNGKPWIVSAQHVLKEKETETLAGEPKFKCLACSKDNGMSPFPLDGPFYGCQFPCDLAIVPIPDWTSDSRSAVDSSRLALDSNSVEASILFIQGFPGEKSFEMSTGVAAKAVAYLSGPGSAESPPTWFDPELHFVIAYDAKGLVDDGGRNTHMVNPSGFSGSAVWALQQDEAPEKAEIIGVVIAYGQESQVLYATRVEFLHHLLGSAEQQYRSSLVKSE